MPGHPIPPNPASLAQAKADVAKLEKLMDEHDVVFQLMDSRESRWLPTVMGAAKGKASIIIIRITTCKNDPLTLRVRSCSTLRWVLTPTWSCGTVHARLRCPQERMGNLIRGWGVITATISSHQPMYVLPFHPQIHPDTQHLFLFSQQSLTDRTLDQMCTVTRPGLAPIAAATAVELLASLLQHPDGLYSPAPPPTTTGTSGADPGSDQESANSVLGLVPHQLRGFLNQFRTMPLVGAAYDRCTGCSETVSLSAVVVAHKMLIPF